MASQYYILLQDKTVESKSMIPGMELFGLKKKNLVIQGSLLMFAGRTRSYTSSTTRGSVYYHLADDPTMRVECEAHEVEHLTINEYEWLLPINQPKDRYEFYIQKEKYTTVTTLAVGDRVWMFDPEKGHESVDQSSRCSATVRYIGPVPEKRGNYFGLELEVYVICICKCCIDFICCGR